MNIDFHAHIYPEDYLKRLEASTGDVRIETDAKGQKWILSMGAKAGPIIPDFFDTDVRVDRIKEHRVDMQILSSPHPGVDRFSPDESAEMSRIINDGIAKAVRKYPKRFQGLAMLPLIDTKLALKELDRAVQDLGLKGMCMLTNVAGKMVDSEFLLPVYARAQELGVPIFIHPTTPLGAAVMQEWRLAIILGFEFDIVLSATRLAYAGVMDKFPELNFVISHLGAGIPFLAGRIDRGYNDPTCGIKTKKTDIGIPARSLLRHRIVLPTGFDDGLSVLRRRPHGAWERLPVDYRRPTGCGSEHRGNADPQTRERKNLGRQCHSTAQAQHMTKDPF